MIQSFKVSLLIKQTLILQHQGTGNVSKGWKVGDEVYKLTSKGNEPAWNTVRSRFWKKEEASADAVEIWWRKCDQDEKRK